MKKKLIYIFVLLLMGNIFFNAKSQQDDYSPNPEVERLLYEGVDLHKKKDYLGALKAFSDALDIEPNNVLVRQNISIAHNNYGKYLTERTDYDKALKEFRLGVYFDPENKTSMDNLDALLTERGVKVNDSSVRSQLGDKLREDAQFEQALIEYTKAYALSKEPNPIILLNIGDIYYILYLRDGQKTKDIYKAIDFYKKSLEAKKTTKGHIKLGDALLGIKDIVGAINEYKKAIALEPTSQEALTANIRGWNEAVRLAPLVPENHIGLASALQLKKDFVNAEEEYNQALKLDPENEIALKGLKSLNQDKLKLQASKYLDLALKFQQENKLDEAIGQYVKALEITPHDPKLHYNIGTAFQAKEDFEHAEKAYKKSLEIDPENEKAKIAIELLIKQINNKKVQELSTRALELQGSENFQEAITTYLAAISINPQDASLYYNLGTAYQRQGDLNNAIAQYEKAFDLNKENATYLNAIKLAKVELANPLIQSAVTKQTTNDLTGAIVDYLKALELIPDDGQTHFNLATAYQANGQIDNAIQSYLKAIQLDPKEQLDAYFFLAVLYEEKKNNKQAIDYYGKYLQNAPTGTYSKDAKDRMAYLKTLKG